MNRTTVKVPEDLDRAMRDEAARRGITVSEWTREAIEAHLPGPRNAGRLVGRGAGGSGRVDISARVQEILAEELGAAR